jgi:hypothetical protein
MLLMTGFGLMVCSSQAQTPPKDLPQGPPKPIEPPHKPAQQGFRFTTTIGFSLIGSGRYSYKTSVILPDGREFAYNGTERSSGATLSLGAAATPGGTLRRFTLGFDLNFGGLDVSRNAVIPAGSVTPFSQSNLNAQVARKTLISSPWRPFISPYIEHEIGSIFQNRVRLGYEYLSTSRSSSGTFVADPARSIQGRYSVRFSQTSHMIRVSAHNDTWFDDTGAGQPPPKRRSGVIQQGGVLIGIDGTLMVFVNLGPVWTF